MVGLKQRWALAAAGFVMCTAAAGGQELISEPVLARVGFVPYWQAQLPFRRGDTPLAAHLIEGTLYVATRQGEIHSVDAITGVANWTRHVTEVGRTLRRPSHLTTEPGRAAVVVTHADGADFYDRLTGESLAEVRELWSAGSAAVADELMLYVGSSDGHLYAIRWYDPVHRTPVVRWRVLAGGPVTSAPSLWEDTLYFSSQSGKVYACTADRRKDLIWQFSTEAALEAEILVDAEAVYVAGLDRSLYRLDRETGALKWRRRFPHPLRESPILAQGVLYQYESRGGLTAVDAENGEPLWAIPEGRAFASRGAERTCVTLAGGRVAVLESVTGIAVGPLTLEREAIVPANRDGAPFYVIAVDGRAACYAPRDMPWLRPEDLNRRTPIGPSTRPAEPSEEAPEETETPPEAAGRAVNDPLRSRNDG